MKDQIKPSDVSSQIRWDCDLAKQFALDLLEDVNHHRLVREIEALPELIDLVEEVAKGTRNLLPEDFDRARALLIKIKGPTA